ncbi:hypothetical protein INS49_005019 [Diaporthe citri]|uniref:uncharacterized protein n=1 Tax=Diaporthe citri TaxID=83186 RepID=UPI001C81B924|nr:uncharacterized protein INS49_005019 [Diaporthe citri]KAG6354048.1 hypothetical protein INS49_005019 [Diaporthe citri]
MTVLRTKDLEPLYRPCVHPQEVAPPMQPAPPPKHETADLEGGKVLFKKDIAITMRDAVPRDKFQNMDVDFGKLSKYTTWELPDPLRWCGEFGFSMLSVDPRGTWWSEGDANHLSPEEGRDGYDIVEWVAEQPYWSS